MPGTNSPFYPNSEVRAHRSAEEAETVQSAMSDSLRRTQFGSQVTDHIPELGKLLFTDEVILVEQTEAERLFDKLDKANFRLLTAGTEAAEAYLADKTLPPPEESPQYQEALKHREEVERALHPYSDEY